MKTLNSRGKSAIFPAFCSVLILNDGNANAYSLESNPIVTLSANPEVETPLPRQRDDLLLSVAQASNALLLHTDLDAGVQAALAALITASSIDRVHVFENHQDAQSGLLYASQRYAWTRGDATPQTDNPEMQNVPYANCGPRWADLLSDNQSISGVVRDFPQSERESLAA